MYSISLISTLAGLFILCIGCSNAKRQWDYEPLSIDPYTSDSSKLKIEAYTERVGRDEYALTIKLGINYVIDEKSMIEVTAYRSSSGSEDDYNLIPWVIEKQTWSQFVKEYYTDFVYKNFGPCSNMPKTEDVDPLPKGNYNLEKCTVVGDGMPEIAPEGYYKIDYKITGEVDWGFVAICKVFPKSYMG